MKPIRFLACAAALIAVAGCNSKQGNEAATGPVKLEQVPPPKGGDWTTVVSATPAGGFMMGNPNAKVHLVEYGSLTCPHCQRFDESGVTPLVNTYVKSGQVSYEFRNYVRDPIDLAASLIARCNGPAGFFPLARAFYKDQANWMAKVQTAPPAQLEALQNLPPNQIGLATAKVVGFPEWAAMRGLPEAKSTQCLTNANEVNRLVEMNADATQKYPDFPGTPTFILNDKMVEMPGVTEAQLWPALEGKIREALR